MKIKFLVLILMALFSPAIFAQDAKSVGGVFSLKDLDWLTGCWVNIDKYENADEQVVEHWLRPSMDTMLGIGQTTKFKMTKSYEFMRIYQGNKGEIYFAAKLPGQDEVSFKFIGGRVDEFIFENKEHDFPQRVIYLKNKDGSMTGTIEGKRNGQEKSLSIPMKRTGCE